jgi:hypothetical protein
MNIVFFAIGLFAFNLIIVAIILGLVGQGHFAEIAVIVSVVLAVISLFGYAAWRTK